MSKVLILSPHVDDGELGCGATIAKLIDQGDEVVYVALSEVGNEKLRTECHDATHILGIRHTKIHSFPVRNFPSCRQRILDLFVSLKRTYSIAQSDLVFMPSSTDIHQDHQVVYQEGRRAFKHCSILGYDLPWNEFESRANCYYHVSGEHMRRKLTALAKYKSQADKPYLEPASIWNRAMARGLQVEVEFAEAFEVIRWIIK